MILIETTSYKGNLLGYNIDGDLVARECVTCKEYLPISGFGKNILFVGGIQCECKSCVAITRKKNAYKRASGKKEDKIKFDENGSVLGRICSKCKVYKDKHSFGVQNHHKNKSGISSSCKDCAASDRKIRTENGKSREAWLKCTYGISSDTYEIMLAKQEGVCSICKGTVPNKFTANKDLLVVDHCHTTSKVRSLLCSSCNITVGRFEKSYNEESTKRFFDYLDFCKKMKDTYE